MSNFIGIDLGTTFSAVAALDDTGRPKIIHNAEGSNITPSCVLIEGVVVTVGEDARKLWGVDPRNVGARFKRDMGTDRTYEINSRTLTPVELSALVLKKIKADTESSIGPISEAVVTIPANFANEAREATLLAARQAGLNVKHIINEPTAAALYYAFKMGHELSGTYAVYDFGGGTFDVSVIKVAGQDVDVVTSHGVNRLGGDDFDQALQDLVAKKYKAKTGFELDRSLYSKNDAEEDKKSLGKRPKVLARVGQEVIDVTRTEFEASISSYIAQAEMLCETAIEEARDAVGAVSGVFLVGGTTRVPAVRESVRRVFGVEPTSTVNVDEVVALGASLYAAYKTDRSALSTVQRAAVSTIKFSEVTNFCFGTLMRTSDPARNTMILANDVIIEKNAKIPCSVTKTYYTIREDQDAVDCTVTQSVDSERDPRFVKKIWEGELPLPKGRPADQPINVTYGFDANNVMSCTFRDVGSEKEMVIDLRPNGQSGATVNIDKFLVE